MCESRIKQRTYKIYNHKLLLKLNLSRIASVTEKLSKIERLGKEGMASVLSSLDGFSSLCLGLLSEFVKVQQKNVDYEAALGLVEVSTSMEDVRGEIRALREEIAARSASVPAQSAPIPAPRAPSTTSFSQVVASPPRALTVVELRPAEGVKGLETPEEIKKALIKNVEPKEQGWQVVGLRSRGKAVRLSFGSVDAAKRVIRSDLLAKAGIAVKEVDKFKPRVILYDVPRETPTESVLGAIKAQNFPAQKAFGGSSWGSVSHEFGKRGSCCSSCCSPH